MLNSNLAGLIILISYYILAASGVSLYDYFTSHQREWIRKSYHLIYCFAFYIVLYIFADWQASLMVVVGISLLALPVLKLAERVPLLMKLSISRSRGSREVIKQMLYFHGVFIILILLFQAWWPQNEYHALLGIVVLAFGDSSAAIIGKYLGRINYRGVVFSRAKTLEGSIGFIVFSFVPVLLTLYLLTDYGIYLIFLVATILVLVAAFVEALSRRGLDTITIPLTVALISVFLEYLFF